MAIRCPACGRPVARSAWQCPYCDEALPGRGRALLRAALAWPRAPFAAMCALAGSRAARRRAAPWLAVAGAAGALAAADPAFRTGLLRLWSAHGPGLALAAAAVSALCRKVPDAGVSGASGRERILAALRIVLPELAGAVLVAAGLFAALPAPTAAALLALFTAARGAAAD